MLSSRSRSRFVSAGLLWSALVFSCAGGGDDDADACERGTENCGCALLDRCDEGLVCDDDRCVKERNGGGTGGKTSFGGQGGQAASSGASAMGGLAAGGASAGGLSAGGFAGEPTPAEGGGSGEAGLAGESGEGGGSGEAGGAGDGAGESGGNGGRGGKPAAAGRGGMTARGGAAGKAGTSGGGGSAGIGGGSAASGGVGGTAGAGGCAELTMGELLSVHPAADPDPDPGTFASSAFLSLTSPLGGSAPDILTTSFYTGGGYNGHLTGTFALGTGAEANYETCERCVLFRRDADTDDERLFFASSGQMSIAADSEQMLGYASFTLTDLTLTEVTINEVDFVSTPVPDGLCLHLASGSVAFTEADWTCELSWFGTADGCDCGCGGPDPDCEDSNLVTCEYCHCPGDTAACAVTSVDPANTHECLPD